jgi:hypothetical protein
MTDDADKSYRFALTRQDPQGRNRTIILWREVAWWTAPWCAGWCSRWMPR